MSYKLTMEDEPIPQSRIVAVIYAPPGAGKTSLSFTAKDPILLDFDDGLKRAVKRKGAVQFTQWKDVIAFTNSEDFETLAPETLIFDTADTMLNDFIAHEVGKEKGNSRSNGALTQSGYGAMKHVFDAFFSKFKGKKDIIFICHEQEDKRDDKAVIRPKITGGAYNIIIQKADLIGYLDVTTEDGKQIRRIDFNPSETRYAKNFAEFDVIEIPHYTAPEYDGFMADLIQQAKEKMSAMSEAQIEAKKKVKELSEAVAEIKTLEEANEVQKEAYSVSKIYQAQIQKELDARFIDLYTEKIKGTKDMAEFDSLSEEIGKLTNRYKTALAEIYNTVYRRHWHKAHTDQAKNAQDLTNLIAEITKLSNSKDLPASGIPLKYSTLGIELIEAAKEKGFQYNKPLKKFERPEQKTEEAKESDKKPVEERSDSDGQEPGKPREKAKVDKLAQMKAEIDAASTYEELEPIEEAISNLGDQEEKKSITKYYFLKLNQIEGEEKQKES